MKTAIRFTREQDFPQWYLEVIKEADLAETSDVRGCMVFKPLGYAIWENMQRVLDQMFKDTGHENVYFPLFIPLSYLQKEAQHVEGFAKECAVVTHHRLKQNAEGELVPDGELAEPLIVRPTSETIIGESFSRWVESYRDLPILINQWANVVRWEMRTRPFLRTAEFLWQEGHTAHASQQEAEEETAQMLQVYKTFLQDYLAIPVIDGEKTESERFPGAVNTYTVETMMQSRKALQAGTSHFLGQNFAKAADIKFQNKDGEIEHAYTTSWGVSTRLIGGLIMTHSDDNGLVLPPKIAPIHVVILPIYKDDSEKKTVFDHIEKITSGLEAQQYDGKKIQVKIDDRDIRGGEKNWQWIKKGVPLKLEVGPKDVEKGSVAVVRRDHLEKSFIEVDTFVSSVVSELEDLQTALFDAAKKRLDDHSREIDDKDAFVAFFTPKNSGKPELHGGFAHSHWCGDAACEEQINKDLSVSIRVLPNEGKEEKGNCVYCGGESPRRVVFAKAY